MEMPHQLWRRAALGCGQSVPSPARACSYRCSPSICLAWFRLRFAFWCQLGSILVLVITPRADDSDRNGAASRSTAETYMGCDKQEEATEFYKCNTDGHVSCYWYRPPQLHRYRHRLQCTYIFERLRDAFDVHELQDKLVL